MASVLFIPDRFMDYRMWSDVPDRLRDRAEAIHFDQSEPVPWTAANGGFLTAARLMAPARGFSIVAAAGQAARFGFAVAEAGLANGLVLFSPWLDRVVPETRAVLDEVDLSAEVEPFVPIAEALGEPDPGRRREILLQVVRETIGPGLDPAELDLALAMASDHAEEYFADLRAAAAVATDDTPQPDPPWLEHPWVDRLGDLNLPVMVVVGPRARSLALAIAARAKDAEIVISAASPGLAPVAERIRTAQLIDRMLDRVS